MQKRVAVFDIEDFYYLSRTTLVKDERHLDRFDRVFGHCFKGIETPEDPKTELPDEWLRKLAERLLTPEEKAQVEALGGWDKLMETLRQRLAEQKGRHQGGRKWIGTAGTAHAVAEFNRAGGNLNQIARALNEIAAAGRAGESRDRLAALVDELRLPIRTVQGEFAAPLAAILAALGYETGR